MDVMSLEDEIKLVLDDFENTTTEKIFEILNKIKPQFKNELISEYLKGKIQKISDVNDEVEKKKQCKGLIPYFDWYLQGLP
jgi:thermostable 8-oxoguanine DNA glycosylase